MPILAGAGPKNFEARVGDTWTSAFQWKMKNPDFNPALPDSEDNPQWILKEFTDEWTWIMQVRKTAKSATVILELSTENGYIIPDPETSRLYFEVPAEIMAGTLVKAGVYGYDLQYTTPEGVVKTLLAGKFKIADQYTR